MKFKELEYKRPDLDKLLVESNLGLDKLENAKTKEEFFEALKDNYDLYKVLGEMSTIASIRNSIDTADEFYEKEVQAYNEFFPKYQQVSNRLSKIRLASPFRKDFEEKYGDTITKKDELEKDIFDPSIIEDRVKEADLQLEYTKLVASAKIDFQGELRNLSQMSSFYESKDREVRKEAFEKVNAWFSENQAELDRLYDELVLKS